VAIGDLNGDGKPDLATANFGFDTLGTVSVLLGMGDGTFGVHTDFPTGDAPYSVAIGDLNRDGKLDLATANFSANTVSVLLGDGAGGFGTSVDFATGAGPSSVVMGDLNRDGKPDLAVANNKVPGTVSVLLNTTPLVAAPPGAPVAEFALGPIAPNPSRGSAHVPFALPREAQVRVRLLDIMGRRVAALADAVYPAGRHEVTWNNSVRDGAAPAGVYLVRCEMDGKTFVRRVVMSR